MFKISEALKYGARCRFSNQFVEVVKSSDAYFLKYHNKDDIGIDKQFHTYDDLEQLLVNFELKPPYMISNIDSFKDVEVNDLFYFSGDHFLLISKYNRNGLSYLKYINVFTRDVIARTILEEKNEGVQS